MPTVKFDKSFMLEVLDGAPDTKIIEDKITGHGRWTVTHTLVFSIENKYHITELYKTHYRVGATENQEEGPWEGADEVECTAVKPVEKTIIVYEPV